MDTQAKGSRAVGGARIERAIVLQLLGDDREQVWSRERLGVELGADRASPPSPKAVAAGEAGTGRDPDVEAGLRRLEGEGVLCLSEQEVWVSRATRRLDELGLIGV